MLKPVGKYSDECISFEKSHNTPVKIANVKYNNHKSDGAYPQYI